ncbi:MAG: hypothetical protein MJ196_04335 [Treponemataceae bacterium]|nr:hypothetical protein [Treponemataceae bacterium]
MSDNSFGEKLKGFFKGYGEFDFKKAGNSSYIAGYLQDHLPQAYGIIAFLVLLIFMSLLPVFATVIQSNKKEKKQKVYLVKPVEDELVLPAEPGIDDSYQFYREQKRKWSREDAEVWFTAPDDLMLKELEQTNNALISDVLGAAP